ncbi:MULTISPECIES: methyl-accepting chemotaxis protein [unclassified Neptuniibacter]|uniref:HAMP domain-containing methyl-accepting chemotaxis protein n=1 Tax=unclassified Neptuniibacter TaxID=2630693 RepID=UPI000C630FF8|nr:MULTISPECIES: methyl-accepting chemotaxis protein [unclassified Neptuniibacter]MAY40810.1 hypothetical protein [Oceanospirillaceae bacterium]|tara:strand:- start:5488 stop:7449 length:1962 start_codon:yes stop_codon:yes gene_type:complete
MNILNSLSLRSKIGMSFGFILILLVTASGAGVSGLQHSEEGFVKYRELARDTNLSGRLQANMLKVRMAVKNFLISHESTELEQYQNRMGLMNQFLEQSKNEISNPERSRLIMETDSLLTRYQNTFDEVVALIGKEDQLYYDVLVKQGPIMRKQITQLRELSQIEANSDKMYLLGNLKEDLLLARLYLVRFLEKGHADDYNVAIEKLDQALNQHTLALEENFLTVQESEFLAVFHQARTLYLAATQDIFAAQNERNRLVSGTLDVIGPQVAKNVEQVKLSVMAEQDKLGPMLQSKIQQDLLVVGIISLIAIVLGSFFAFMITRMITRPILDAVSFANTLAQGDLSQEINCHRGDEVGKLNVSLGDTTRSLRDMITEITHASRNMSTSAEELAVLTEQAKSGTLLQQEETDQVAAAVTEMAHTAQHVATNASQAAESADNANHQVKQGRGQMQRATEGMTQLSSSLEETSLEVQQLQQKTCDINAILDVIREIAEQTNLLALNAAIEAARAGEQGRGFAVVADEVRGLAKRTQESTEMIHNLIGDLQQRANFAVSVMNKGTDEANGCIQLVDQADDALNEISAAVERMSDVNTLIASSAEEQSVAAEQISKSVCNVRVIAEQSRSAADETSNSSVHLSEVANRLGVMVQRFRLTR